jgi:hypothetical protein
MATCDPVTELHQQFSSDTATATPWADAVAQLETAEVFWLSTVRPDGRSWTHCSSSGSPGCSTAWLS